MQFTKGAIKILYAIIPLIFSSVQGFSQLPDLAEKRPLLLSVFSTGTQLPGGGVLGVFPVPVHPGLCAGTEFRYNRHLQRQWFQTVKVAVSYHRYVQTAVELYSEAGYRQMIWRGTGAEFRLGGGYLHAIPAAEIFRLRNGVYEKKTNFGRAQAMLSAALGLSYAPPALHNKMRFFLDYQFFLQMPFVKQYVPLLPNTALHAGVAFPFFTVKNKTR